MEPCWPKEFIKHLMTLKGSPDGRGEDRAALADLRHGIGVATAERAWPHIAPFCDLRDRENLAAFAVVGAGFALHGGTDPRAGNMGNSLRRLAVEGKDSKKDALNSFAGRFRRLLTCNSTSEVCALMPGILRATARQGIPVYYEMLLNDLRNWNKDVKVRWAQSYWGAPSEQQPAAQEGGEE